MGFTLHTVSKTNTLNPLYAVYKRITRVLNNVETYYGYVVHVSALKRGVPFR